ncbi:MAG: ferritin family protein [bacterium]
MKTDLGIIAGIREAMLAEQAGNQFYSAAAGRTTDPRGSEVFLMLAVEEARHLDFLREQYRLLAAGRPPEPLISDTGAELGGPSPIFSDELRSRIGEAHWEMTALSVGLQLEEASIARYRDLAARAASPELRQFFERLVRWEEGHAAALERQSRLLRDDYWNAAGFAPF